VGITSEFEYLSTMTFSTSKFFAAMIDSGMFFVF